MKALSKQKENYEEYNFDELLRQSVPEFPPEEIARKVTPWKKAMNRILVGLALNAITLNFLLLNYILPMLGLVLMLLGFRSLQKENKWFKSCYIFTMLKTVLQMSGLILSAMILEIRFVNILGITQIIIQIVLLFCIWKGFQETKKKVQLSPIAKEAFALLVWYLGICILALLVQSNVLLVAIGMIIIYILIIRSLWKLSEELEEAGYAIQVMPLKISDYGVTVIILGILVAGIAGGYLFGNSYSMQWKSKAETEQAEAASVKAYLKSMGFPEEILEDMSDEDILECEGAKQIVKDVHYHQFEMESVEDEMCITGIAVELAGKPEQWKIIQHFRWISSTDFYGTEALHLWPTYRFEEWNLSGTFSGRVLYDRNGETYVSPYHSLESETYTQDTIFWGEQQTTDVFATFSLPNEGENHRGYISYTVKEMQDGCIIDAWIHYVHQETWLQYPVKDAKEYQMTYSPYSSYKPFHVIEDALQFYPNDDPIEIY